MSIPTGKAGVKPFDIQYLFGDFTPVPVASGKIVIDVVALPDHPLSSEAERCQKHISDLKKFFELNRGTSFTGELCFSIIGPILNSIGTITKQNSELLQKQQKTIVDMQLMKEQDDGRIALLTQAYTQSEEMLRAAYDESNRCRYKLDQKTKEFSVVDGQISGLEVQVNELRALVSESMERAKRKRKPANLTEISRKKVEKDHETAVLEIVSRAQEVAASSKSSDSSPAEMDFQKPVPKRKLSDKSPESPSRRLHSHTFDTLRVESVDGLTFLTSDKPIPKSPKK